MIATVPDWPTSDHVGLPIMLDQQTIYSQQTWVNLTSHRDSRSQNQPRGGQKHSFKLLAAE